MCLQKLPPSLQIYLKSATGQLPKLPTCACRNSPPVCRFSKICHWTDTYMCLQKFPPGVQIVQNLPLYSYLSYLHVLAEIPPPRFSKICHWTDTYMCLQKFPPGVCRFSKICHWTDTTCACRNSPWGADFPKSATGQLPKLPTCACRNSPQIFQNLPLDSYLCASEIPPQSVFQNLPLDRYLSTCACRNSPQFADFPKSATGQIPTCACRNSPQFADFPKSATGQLP